MRKLLQEFKEFAMRGNVVDMAVGVVIGGAFGKIVSSLVGDIIMPAISILTGKVNFTELVWAYSASLNSDPIVIKYGMFLQTVFDFIIIALSIFLVIKLMNQLQRKKTEDVPPAPPEPSKEQQLLTEIRDLLKDKKDN